MIHFNKDVWDKVTAIKKPRVLMLGVPNEGSYGTIRILLGKDSVIKIRGYYIGIYCSIFMTDTEMTIINRDTENYEIEKIKTVKKIKPKFCLNLPK